MRIKIRHTSITNIIIFLMFTFASLDLFQISGKTFFFYLGLIFILYSIVNKGKINILKDPLIIAIFAEFLISGIFAQFSGLNRSYKKTAIIMPILVLPIFLEAGIFEGLIKRKTSILQVILKGIRLACIIQFIYIPVQYFLYHYTGIDLNKEIFVNALGLVESASFIRDWVWYPSGTTWHSAIVAPLMVIGIVLFDSYFFKFLILFDALICGSSSAIIGVIVALLLSLLFKLLRGVGNNKIKRHAIFGGMCVIIFASIVLISTDFLSLITYKFGYIYERLFTSMRDSSTSAHLLYYLRYPSIVSESSISQILFGYRYNCSGFIFSALDNRYNLGSWSVESEVMDRVYSLGLIGFILYSIFLLKIVVSGAKIDYKYTITMIAIIIQGFGYNLQWDYVFLIELIFYICIKMKINIFEIR